MDSVLVKHQKKVYGWKEFNEDGETYRIKAVVRYDDECGNGHNTFSITGTIERRSKNGRWLDDRGGCIHEEIAKHFPELSPLIKWHLVSSDEPMHYFANTLYLAGVKDCHGLKKGEFRQFRDRETGLLSWKLSDGIKLEKYVDSATRPEGSVTLVYEPWGRTGEGKEPEIESARRTAIWADATLEQLQSKEALEAHLAEIMPQFKRDVESLGFVY